MDNNKAVFLDRDGVITEDPPHYAHRIDQLRIIPGGAQAIQRLNAHNFRVIIISNQSGVARGYYIEEDVKIFNDGMAHLLAKEGSHVDAVYYCPHHPDGIIERYKIDCGCRKPKPGMILEAAQNHSLDIQNSFVVGDKWSDIEAGKNAGCQTILVLTGHGTDESLKIKDNCLVTSDLYEAVSKYIIGRSNSTVVK